jgi:hypothetical protein
MFSHCNINSASIFDLDAKFGVDIPDTHASAVGDHAHEAGANVADLVVVVQEPDMPLHGSGGIWGPVYPLNDVLFPD